MQRDCIIVFWVRTSSTLNQSGLKNFFGQFLMKKAVLFGKCLAKNLIKSVNNTFLSVKEMNSTIVNNFYIY